ncbi:MAG: cytochrome c oxidase subunit 3 [Pseudomonadota bacterium]
MGAASSYYVPHEARWPIIGSIGLMVFFYGFGMMLNGGDLGLPMLLAGVAILIIMMFGWFGLVAKESEAGTYDSQVDTSFRMGMMWFIFSEVMFFGAFFGALFYARILSGPWIGGVGEGGAAATNEFLWNAWEYVWPNNGPAEFGGMFKAMGAWGLPAINTAILLTSGITCTLAHHAVKENHRKPFILWLFATVALGFIFVGLQAWEYIHAYEDLNLKLSSGIYGSTFFLLTGFHGFHVSMGAIILLVVMLRAMKGHFSPTNHFAFEAAAWYWHFVDVVWLGLFVFVYWI